MSHFCDSTDGLRLVQMRGDGDCMRAAVATILGLELDDIQVPNGSTDNPEPVERAWHEWLAERGLAKYDTPAYGPIYLPLWVAMVATGPDRERHALVMRHDEILHDPATAPGSPQAVIDPRDILTATIVGPAEWVDEQARQIQVFANTDPSRVWHIGEFGALLRQMMQGEFT